MKMNCNVIKDLLPLYYDKVCSEETMALVQEHIENCETCHRELELIEKEVKMVPIEMDATDTLRKISNKWEKGRKRSFLKGTLITISMVILLFGAYVMLTKWKCIPVGADNLVVSQVSMLKDGRIIYHLNVKDGKEIHFEKFVNKGDGTFYITPMRSVIEEKRTEKTGIFQNYFMIDVAEDNAYEKHHGNGAEITSYYIGTEDNGTLVWEKGMKLPQANDAMEEMAN